MQFIRPFRRSVQLNQVELWKLERHPLDVADAVRDRYASLGVAAIEAVPGELERLKWVGIYPQRQGGDALMLRVKVPGGRLTAAQARCIGEIADEFARGPRTNDLWPDGVADITTRQDIQLHWLHIADIPEIWRRLEEVGLTTVQACGDSARNVLCCPVSGLDVDEVIYALPVAEAISAYFTGNREYANLPRKFKMSVTGCLDDCAQAEINDIGLWPARLDDAAATVGFNVLVGGGLSDGPRMASDIDVFVTADQAVELTRAIAQLYGELGNRENRGLARMRYLVQELGPEEFRAQLARRAAFSLAPAGKELTSRYRGDRLAARYGAGEIRLSTDQNFILTGVPEARLEALLDEELLQRYSPFPKPFERGVVACTGSEFCRFAIVETKQRAVAWARDMDRRFGDIATEAGGPSDTVIRMHFSGCPASCGQPQIADIGFRGETAHVGDQIVEAVDIALGGSLGADAAFADFVSGAVPVDDVPDALARVVAGYSAGHRPGERFHEWTRRNSLVELRQILDGAVVGGSDR